MDLDFHGRNAKHAECFGQLQEWDFTDFPGGDFNNQCAASRGKKITPPLGVGGGNRPGDGVGRSS
jgi:hypothetical protein